MMPRLVLRRGAPATAIITTGREMPPLRAPPAAAPRHDASLPWYRASPNGLFFKGGLVIPAAL